MRYVWDNEEQSCQKEKQKIKGAKGKGSSKKFTPVLISWLLRLLQALYVSFAFY
jgi:hypothetical protein